MSMDTTRDLFEHELLDMYDAEHRVLKALPAMAKDASDEKLQAGFDRHAKETQAHIERIEQACESLGVKPERETCPGMAGLIKEHDQFVKENPAPEVMTLFLLSAGQKTEHYEIVGYRGLIRMAKLLGETDVAKLLSETLKEEEAMADQLEKLEQRSAKTLVGATS